MKQCINSDQWNELSLEQQLVLSKNIKEIDTKAGVLPSIGEMIAFLGDDWFNAVFSGNLCVKGDDVIIKSPRNEDLCNILWQACKHKLND